MGNDMVFFKAPSGCCMEKRPQKGGERGRMEPLRVYCNRVGRGDGDLHCGEWCWVESGQVYLPRLNRMSVYHSAGYSAQ